MQRLYPENRIFGDKTTKNEKIKYKFEPIIYIDTSILDTSIPAPRSGAFARGIAAEPPKREMRSMSAKVMERIARREAAKLPKRLAQIDRKDTVFFCFLWQAEKLALVN
jgi:hypothetical protein